MAEPQGSTYVFPVAHKLLVGAASESCLRPHCWKGQRGDLNTAPILVGIIPYSSMASKRQEEFLSGKLVNTPLGLGENLAAAEKDKS